MLLTVDTDVYILTPNHSSQSSYGLQMVHSMF